MFWVLRARVLLRLLPLLLMFGAGCASESLKSELAHVSDPIDLPVPTEEVVLTIHGSIKANVEDRLELDLAGIESVGAVVVSVEEPFVEETLRVTAEGIETVEQAEALVDIGVQAGQGYSFARPCLVTKPLSRLNLRSWWDQNKMW